MASGVRREGESARFSQSDISIFALACGSRGRGDLIVRAPCTTTFAAVPLSGECINVKHSSSLAFFLLSQQQEQQRPSLQRGPHLLARLELHLAGAESCSMLPSAVGGRFH